MRFSHKAQGSHFGLTLGPVSAHVKNNFPIIHLIWQALAHHTCVGSLECQRGMELVIVPF